jgi:peptidoglycan/LPS O-acetylase OafA/YrhL
LQDGGDFRRLAFVAAFFARRGALWLLRGHNPSVTEIPSPAAVSGPQGGRAFYRPELDALRLFAFLSVFAFHRMDYTDLYSHRAAWAFRLGTIGAFGVPVFFLLSAYLITELLLRERDRTGSVHVGAFYVRRILRIWPLYFAAFYGLAVLERFLPGVGARDPRAWLAFSLFSGNWYITFHDWINGPVDPLWSISVEEQFYILIPLIAALGGKRGLKWAAAVFLGASYATVLWYGLHPVKGDNAEWTNSLPHFQFFCGGMLLALLLHGREAPRLPAQALIAMAGAGATLWLMSMLVFHVQSWEPHATAMGAVLGWMAILGGCVMFFFAALGWGLVPRWIAYLGRISYGLYVFHCLFLWLFLQKLAWMAPRYGLGSWPGWLRSLGGVVLVLGCTVGTAALSFRFFERPFLRLKKRFTFVAAREEALG